jgi:hypothetical protein
MKLLAALATIVGVLPGCAVQLYGNQSAGPGTTAAATSSQVLASAASGNARVSFSSGQPVAPMAPGGQVRVTSGSGAAALAAVVGVAGLIDYMGGGNRPKPLPPGTRISHTCSCYGYQPVMSDE